MKSGATKTTRFNGPRDGYPWASWFARQRFVLWRGLDYEVRSDVMAQMLRNAARPERHGVPLRHVWVHEDRVEVEVGNGKR